MENYIYVTGLNHRGIMVDPFFPVSINGEFTSDSQLVNL